MDDRLLFAPLQIILHRFFLSTAANVRPFSPHPRSSLFGYLLRRPDRTTIARRRSARDHYSRRAALAGAECASMLPGSTRRRGARYSDLIVSMPSFDASPTVGDTVRRNHVQSHSGYFRIHITPPPIKQHKSPLTTSSPKRATSRDDNQLPTSHTQIAFLRSNRILSAATKNPCDTSKERIEPTDMAALSIGRRTKRYRIHLCGKCSAGLIEMLKDMRLIKTKAP
jgi:hypothetical protein